MSHHDDDRPPDDGNRRRKRVMLGAAGLAAVLGAGAYVLTAQVMDHKKATTTADTGALAPMITPASEAPPSAVASADLSTASSPSVSPSATPSSAAPSPSRGTSVDERIRKAREKAAKDGYPVQRALTAAPHAESGPVSERSVPRPNGGSLRIITAKFDLSGQRELLWAADNGKPVGDSRCTQNFHFSNNMKPSIRPNLLLCWRTSAGRSVATVLVDQNNRPSTTESVQIIDREWAKLG